MGRKGLGSSEGWYLYKRRDLTNSKRAWDNYNKEPEALRNGMLGRRDQRCVVYALAARTSQTRCHGEHRTTGEAQSHPKPKTQNSKPTRVYRVLCAVGIPRLAV